MSGRLRDAAAAALACMDWHLERGTWGADLEGAAASLRAALAAEGEGGKGDAVAWMHPDGRVIPASTMSAAKRDGGAMLSSVAGYAIPCYAHPPAQPTPGTKLVAMTMEQARRIYDSATHAAAMTVFMTRISSEQPDADDLGVSGWLMEAENRVKSRAGQSLDEILGTFPDDEVAG